jgi:hypothetical protein
MRITWTQTTRFEGEFPISLEDLALWACSHLPGVIAAGAPAQLQGTGAEQLLELVRGNEHLRDRLISLYLQSHQQTTTPFSTTVDVDDVDPHPTTSER